MSTHKHARLTFARRLQMVQQLTFEGFSVAQAAAEHGVTPARKWLARYLPGGESALDDASSRPAKSPRSTSPVIVELRRRHLLQARIALAVGVSESTVSRVLARAGLSKLSDLKPVEPVQRYEHEAPGDLLHIDTKKLGRIVRPSHRVTGDRRDRVGGAGWETLFVAVDDHARIAFTQMQPDGKSPQAVRFLRKDLGIQRRFTRAYRPQTNGKAERFIQSALREWAYGWTYQNSRHHTAALASWMHHYNWHRPHSGIGDVAPMTRLSASVHNVLTLHI